MGPHQPSLYSLWPPDLVPDQVPVFPGRFQERCPESRRGSCLPLPTHFPALLAFGPQTPVQPQGQPLQLSGLVGPALPEPPSRCPPRPRQTSVLPPWPAPPAARFPHRSRSQHPARASRAASARGHRSPGPRPLQGPGRARARACSVRLGGLLGYPLILTLIDLPRPALERLGGGEGRGVRRS